MRTGPSTVPAMPNRGRILAAAGSLLLLTVAGCSSGGNGSVSVTTAASSGTTDSTGGTGSTGNVGAGTTSSQPSAVTLTITGTGPANDVTIDVDGKENQHTGVALPYRTTITDAANIVVLGAQTASGSPSATLTCIIAVPGDSPKTSTSTGAYTTVQCVQNVNPSGF